MSVPALMGGLMCIGLATANSILVVSFADDKMKEGYTPVEAAIAAGYTRLRPVLMTAAAMILGMLPMAFALRRRRRAERTPWSCGDWWPHFCNIRNTRVCADDVRVNEPPEESE